MNKFNDNNIFIFWVSLYPFNYNFNKTFIIFLEKSEWSILLNYSKNFNDFC
jgi:hypothetical protein